MIHRSGIGKRLLFMKRTILIPTAFHARLFPWILASALVEKNVEGHRLMLMSFTAIDFFLLALNRKLLPKDPFFFNARGARLGSRIVACCWDANETCLSCSNISGEACLAKTNN